MVQSTIFLNNNCARFEILIDHAPAMSLSGLCLRRCNRTFVPPDPCKFGEGHSLPTQKRHNRNLGAKLSVCPRGLLDRGCGNGKCAAYSNDLRFSRRLHLGGILSLSGLLSAVAKEVRGVSLAFFPITERKFKFTFNTVGSLLSSNSFRMAPRQMHHPGKMVVFKSGCLSILKGWQPRQITPAPVHSRQRACPVWNTHAQAASRDALATDACYE